MDLARATLRGEPGALERFTERMRCVAPMLASQNARLGTPLDDEDLADLVQDTLVAVWRKLPDFSGRAALETWVYRFTYLELMNAIRRKRRQPRSQESSEETAMNEPAAREEPSPLEFEHVYRGLERLGPPESEVIRLKHFEQRTFEEVGELLDIPPNTAKTQYYRGLGRLRELMKALGEEEEEA